MSDERDSPFNDDGSSSVGDDQQPSDDDTEPVGDEDTMTTTPSENLREVSGDTINQYKADSEEEAVYRGLSREQLAQDLTVVRMLKTSLILLLLAVGALAVAATQGYAVTSITASAVQSLATAPLPEYDVGGFAVQYAIFAIGSAIISPLVVFLASALGVPLKTIDTKALMQRPSVVVPYVTVQGSIEEVVFRGIPFVLAGVLGLSETGLLVLLVVGSIIWVLAHMSGQYPNTIILGIFFVLLWAGGYWRVGIAVHALHNLFVGIAATVLYQ